MLGANPAVAYEQYDGNGSEGDFDYVLTILCTSFQFYSNCANSYESARITQGVKGKLIIDANVHWCKLREEGVTSLPKDLKI